MGSCSEDLDGDSKHARGIEKLYPHLSMVVKMWFLKSKIGETSKVGLTIEPAIKGHKILRFGQTNL